MALWIIPLCFPGTGAVDTPRGTTAMKDIVVGDTVRVVTPEGRVEWSTVCGWLHREPNTRARYVQLNTSRRQLVVSAEHLVATVNSKGRVEFVKAGEVRQGSTLLEVDGGSSAVWGNAVSSIGVVEGVGVYAPLTLAGTVVVDGVGASCYASTRSHTAAHAAMKPMRALYKHNPEKAAAGQTRHAGKHIEGAHRYVDVLARVTGKVQKQK